MDRAESFAFRSRAWLGKDGKLPKLPGQNNALALIEPDLSS